MGIVLNQSIKNTIVTYLGFGIGAINVLFLYTNFLSDAYYGLITFILSTAMIVMPLMAFGAHNTIIKFYSAYKTRQHQSSFLTLMLIMPIVVIIPLGIVGYICYENLSIWVSKENIIIKEYAWLIYILAIAFAYFEVFYAWAKVQMQSVAGNFLKEIFHRLCIMALLGCLHTGYISVPQLIYGIVGVYVLRVLIMMLYAFSIRSPILRINSLPNLSEIIKYSSLIIIAGSVATVILEIDKFMIGHYIQIENVAYYGVAIFISTIISVPARSMHQITYPLTAKLLNENNKVELKELYHKSSLNLFIISGFIFLLIVLNINELYRLLPEAYSDGLFIVFIIGAAKLFDNLLGNNNAILFNSDYYRMVLFFGFFLAVATIGLNMIFIPEFGIEGAAIATCIAVFVYNLMKIAFVYVKFKMSPFTFNTVKTLLLIIVSILVFYYWEFPFHPITNIVLKSLLISVYYGLIVYRFNLSEDISKLIKNILNL